MNSMEVNKAFAAILTAGIAFMVAGQVGKILVHPDRLHESAISVGEPAPSASQAPATPTLPPIGPLLANANVETGQGVAQRLCAACHSFNEGGRNGVGPNLYGIIGAKHAHIDGFNYSGALKGKEGPWTYDEMNAWLHKPAQYAPGTRMAFAGISNDQQRADVIAYLRSISPNAPPLPPATAPAAAPAPAAPTPAAAPAGGDAGIPAVSPLLAAADPANGEALAKRLCGICHTFNEGGRNGVGPNLYDVVGKKHAHLDNFSYSAALKGKQGPWTYEELNHWLYRPAQYAAGTRMAFAGVNDVKQRADIIAYLRSLSANPQPLP